MSPWSPQFAGCSNKNAKVRLGVFGLDAELPSSLGDSPYATGIARVMIPSLYSLVILKEF